MDLKSHKNVQRNCDCIAYFSLNFWLFSALAWLAFAQRLLLNNSEFARTPFQANARHSLFLLNGDVLIALLLGTKNASF
jgi:hypothetical protein